MKIVFDTNVVLDAIMGRPDSEAATRLLKTVAEERVNGLITANTITDIYYIARKGIGDENAREAIFELLSIFDVASVDGNACVDALNLSMGDYEDAIMAVCAAREDADFIVSRDSGFLRAAGCPVPVREPTQILELLDN